MKISGVLRFKNWFTNFDSAYFFNITFPLILAAGISFADIWGAFWLISHDVIPGWIASPIAIAIWCYQGNTFWKYEQWRASGGRGVFINPGSIAGPFATAIWLLGGMFLSAWNAHLRNK